MTNPKAWRALIARAVEANNAEMAAGTGMSPNQYMERFVRDGKQAVAREVDVVVLCEWCCWFSRTCEF